MNEIQPDDDAAQTDIHFDENRQRYEAILPDSEQVAYMNVQRSANLWVMRGTYVPPAFEGRGVGSALVRRVLAEARAEGVQIYPQCPFTAAYIKRNQQEADLVHPDYLHLVER